MTTLENIKKGSVGHLVIYSRSPHLECFPEGVECNALAGVEPHREPGAEAGRDGDQGIVSTKIITQVTADELHGRVIEQVLMWKRGVKYCKVALP